jgi:hypothetical protein
MNVINMPKMNTAQIREFLSNSNNQMMTVTFTKADSQVRTINGRTGVKKHLKGGVSTIAGKDELFGIYEINGGYKCFNLNRLIEVKMKGSTYVFNHSA